jgi:NADPH-dependent glutamate synthase beta subunit-like oxidoreductase
MSAHEFTCPPEPDVYGVDRVATPPVPAELAPKDDVHDIHYVPAPCQVACPIGTDAPSYIAYIWEGKLEEAFEAITATNPFSSVCGRVCDAPCEPACRRAESDGPLAIRNLKRYVMDELGKTYHPAPVTVTKAETVGIVGGGPAGLTAAQDLAEAGYAVDVYELTDMLGGYMTWGIPAFRCPPDVFREDIDRMLARCPGITLHLSTALGTDVTLDDLKERHDAVLLTIGAWWAKGMELEGRDDRVVDGVSFLRRINGGDRPAMPPRVVVVGAGDVAMDACRAALRLPGCEHVRVLYRRGPDEIPARRDELEGAIAEGIEFVYNVLPVGVAGRNGGLALRCVRTELGERGEDGRRRPVVVDGSEHDYDAGLVILATGQKAVSDHLAERGLMKDEKVRTDWDSMRTDDPKVFAAGDGAFGPSTIVTAMYHGHRAAYYVKSFLEGVTDPLPYRTPFKTRRVPVAQDADWEVFAREHQAFHGVGENPIAFPEIESTYDTEAARREAARCYRCDAETGSADYNVRTREDIFVMARTKPEDARKQRALFSRRLTVSNQAHFHPEQATLDDIVFLPANLSRLVIDPYRDACRVKTKIGTLDLASPFVVTGFDDAATEVRHAVGHGIEAQGLAYLGRRALDHEVHWLQLVVDGEDEPHPEAAAVVATARDGFRPIALERGHGNQLAGLTASVDELEDAIPFALEHGLDLLVLEANPRLAGAWPELAGPPDLSVMRDAIRILRDLNREEDIALLYFGGIRSGTDAAKLVGLGANAVVVGMSLAFAVGGRIEDGRVVFYGDIEQADRDEKAELFLNALRAEASIMPRCTGKTDISNLEPEDLRAISVETARTAGIPLAGFNPKLAGSLGE